MMNGTRIASLLLLSAAWGAVLDAQVCRLSVAGLNRSRQVMGAVSAECPDPIHSAPFGNWGVTSNFGNKTNSHQFDGWCHNSQICDNNGKCETVCTSGWYQWNSCTTDALFTAPNCTLYNTPDCRGQVTTTGINIHGTVEVDVPVGCPRDVDGDALADEGGCLDVGVYDHGPNFMSLYELDPFSPDALVETLYFPATPITTECGVYDCGPRGSEWVAPNGYDPPGNLAGVFAEMAAVVNSGRFLDGTGACPALVPGLWTLNAASYVGERVAPSSLAASFGVDLADRTMPSPVIPPPPSLAGVSVELTDAAGTTHAAGILFVSPGQVNWLVPDSVPEGEVAVSLRRGAELRAAGRVQIGVPAPAIFTAEASGQGVAAALFVRIDPDGSQTTLEAFQCNDGGCSTAPVAAGGKPLYLTLFGTGIRGATSLEATIGGVGAEVQYFGPQPQYPGLDQVNLRVPDGVTGVVTVLLQAGGEQANPVLVELR